RACCSRISVPKAGRIGVQSEDVRRARQSERLARKLQPAAAGRCPLGAAALRARCDMKRVEPVNGLDPALRRLDVPPPGGAEVAAERPAPESPVAARSWPTWLYRSLRAVASALHTLTRPLTRSLRRKLIVTIVVCLLPLALLFAVSISQRYADRRAEELAANREVAEAVAVAAEAYVRNLDHQLRAVGFALGRLDHDQQLAVVQAYLALNRLPYADL